MVALDEAIPGLEDPVLGIEVEKKTFCARSRSHAPRSTAEERSRLLWLMKILLIARPPVEVPD